MKRKLITGLSFGCALFLSTASFGQLDISNAESVVNVTTTSAQQNPAVAMDSMGRYVVVWESEGQDGDGFGIYAQIYNADHTVHVPEFLINSEDVTGDQRYPAVDMDVNGNFTVAWQSNEDDATNGQGWDIYRKLYNIDGNLIGSRFRVNSTVSRNQMRPTVAVNENHVFVGFMSQFGVDDYAIRGRFYQASNGVTLQSVFTINSGSSDHVAHVEADMDGDGQVVIVWQSENQDGSGNGIYAAGYEQPNVQVFSEIQVNTTTAANQEEPAVACDSAGNTMVVWSSFDQDGDHYGVYSRTMDTDGSFGGSSEILVNNTTSGAQGHPNVSTSYQGGKFVTTWTDENGDADGEAVYGRLFEAGAFQGNAVQINTTTNGNQMLSDVAFGDEDYNAVIVWQGGNRKGTSSGGDNSGFGVFAEIVTLEDTTPPIPVCQNFTAYLDGTGNVTINASDIDGGSTDNVGITSYTLNNSSFTCADLGTNAVILTIADAAGNSAACGATVTVLDTISPVAPTLSNVTGQCSATATAPTTLDNCAGPLVASTSDPLTYSSEGTYTITWTFNDGNGNTTNVTQNVIVDDITAPVTPTLSDLTGECSVTATAPTTTDNCAGTVTGTTTDPLTYNAEGTYIITWTFDDGNGNSTTATQNVIVDDVTAPVTPTLADITEECSATITAPTTTDNCVGTVTGTTTDPLVYNAQGTYTITWTFDDGNGNATTATQNVIVDDVTAPVTPTLVNVTAECSVTVSAPTTTDACSGTITGTTTDPLTYNAQGSYTITWTFNDGNGNTTTASQNVIIDDVTAPVTPTLANVTGECSATATAPTTTDACSGTITGTTTDPLTYSTQGTYTITWTFDDGNGNTTTAPQNVIVDDVTAPVTPTLADVTGECSATATAPTTTDNCSGTITGTTTDAITYTAQGTYTITWTFDDGNGNSTTATQNVIVDDVTAPAVPVLADLTGECSVMATAPTTTDNCSGTITGTTSDPLTYNAQGTFTITWTFDDGNGNTSTATQNVIVDDVTAPVVPVLSDVTGECNATATAPTTTDNCSGTVTGTTTDPLTYNTQGTFTITWTFDDGNGNTATATQNVVITDVTPPTASNIDTAYAECIGDVLVDITLVDDETDNCSATPIVTYIGDVASNGTGCNDTIVRTYNVADDAGNNTNVTQIIILNDVTAPTASKPDTVTVSCLANVPAADPTVVDDEADNCATPLVAFVGDVSTNGTGCNDTITRTYSVTDACGNQITVEQLIIVNDDIAPVADVATLTDYTVYCDATPPTPTATDNCAGSLNGVSDVTFPITTPGTTVVTWTYTDACGNTLTQTQNVILENINVDVSSVDDITLQADNNATGVTYQWIDCENNQPVAGEVGQTFTAFYNGDFAVIVTQGGCTDTSACVTIDKVGLTQLTTDAFVIYPNPSTGQFTISFDGNIKAIEMVDVTGRIVMTETEINQGMIDASLLAPGKYTVRLTAESGTILAKPIVIGQK